MTPRDPVRRHPAARALIPVALLFLALACAGCQWMGWIAQAFEDPNKEPKVDTEYRGQLWDKSVAVLVAADDHVLFNYPNAVTSVCQAVSNQLATDVPRIKLIAPSQVVKFQNENPYWNTTPRSDLLKRLKADRLVCVELSEYTTHEPGNVHLWQGQIVGSVGIAEVEASNPDDLVYRGVVEEIFPRNKPVGVLDGDNRTIQLGMLAAFARHTSKLLHDPDTEVEPLPETRPAKK